MKNPFRRIPLATRYLFGFLCVFASGFFMLHSAHDFSRDDKMSCLIVIGTAFLHWFITGVYVFLERRWFRYLVLVFSSWITGSCIEMTVRAWKQT